MPISLIKNKHTTKTDKEDADSAGASLKYPNEFQYPTNTTLKVTSHTISSTHIEDHRIPTGSIGTKSKANCLLQSKSFATVRESYSCF